MKRNIGAISSRRESGGQRPVGGLRRALAAAALATTAMVVAGGATASVAGAASSKVLLVGTYNGHAGQYTTIQAAVNAAKPGDWILVAPGDYHEKDDAKGPSKAQASAGDYGGVVVSTSNLHIRGMNRNTVVVDGTKSGSKSCASTKKSQNFGANRAGRNGIVVYKANNVWVQNLTVCNFLSGHGSSGNEIWWNGVPTTGPIGLHGYWGTYLTATSTYFGGESTAAAYGIFSSNASGGSWNQVYASNMNDSGAYVGACKQTCTVTIDHGWFQYSALGYSGTNSGGQIIVENSKFDHNQDGFDTNSAVSGDPPAPQTGLCPNGGTSKITHTHSCWVFIHNVSSNNNTGDVPAAGSAAAGPVGTGMTVSGGHNDTVMDNTFSTNGAWGTLFVPYPTSGTPSTGQVCTKVSGTETTGLGLGCVFDPESDTLQGNTYTHNGFFNNPTNGDFGQIVLNGGHPQNCYGTNNYSKSTPSNLETAQPIATCGKTSTGSNTGGALLTQVLCDSGFGQCPSGTNYPKIGTHVTLHKLPKLATMPDPCKGVPSNPWCSTKSS